MSAILKIIGILAVLLGLLSVLLDYLPIDWMPYLASLLGVHYIKIVPTENSSTYVLPFILIIAGVGFISLGKLVSGRKAA